MGRIAVVGSYAPSLVNFRGTMLRAFRSAGHEVLACAPEIDESVEHTLRSWGVATAYVSMNRQGVNPLRDVQAFLELYRLFRRWKPDRVLSYTAKPIVYGSLAARTAGAKPYAMMTGLGYNYSVDTRRARLVRGVMNRLYRLAFQACETVIFQNADNAQLLRQMGVLGHKGKIHLINGSGVDINRFAQAHLPRRPVFLCMARLIAEKGIREYVAAARQLKHKYPDAVFQLAGDLEPATPNAVTEKNLQEWTEEGVIDYLGYLEDVRPAIASSSVYVLPSYYREGIPRSILEAMAMGRPIITTDWPGCRETVQNGVNGLLVKPRSVDELITACRWMIEHSHRWAEMGRESRELAVQRFDVRRVNVSIMHAMGLEFQQEHVLV